jgi:ketosteroid isomerase-like protein
MTHPNEAIVRKMFEAYGRGDYDILRSLLYDDVVYHIPGKNVFSRDYVGHGDVFELWEQQKQRMGGKPYRIEISDMLVSDRHVVALTRVEAESAGRTITWQGANVYTIREGKITEARFMLDDLYAYDSFWS